MKNYKFLKKLLVLALILIASSPQMWATDDSYKDIFVDATGCHSWYWDNGCKPYIHYSNRDDGSYYSDWVAPTEEYETHKYRYHIPSDARKFELTRSNGSYTSGSTAFTWINSTDANSDCCYKYHNFFKLTGENTLNTKGTYDMPSGSYVYLYNDNFTTDNNFRFMIGRYDNTKIETPTLISNTTKLYYISPGAYTGFSFWSFVYTNTAWGAGSWGADNITGNATDYTAVKYGYKFAKDNTYYVTKTSSDKGGAVSVLYKSDGTNGIPKCNTTLTVKVREASGGAYSNGSISDKPATTIKITGTYLSAQGTSDRSDENWTSGSSCTYGTIISGKVTPTYATLGANWQFDGWYIGGSSQGTGTSFDFYQTSATDVEARFTRIKYDITLNNHGATSAGTGSVKATYGANTNLTSNISTPSKTGYTFAGYYTGENGTGTQLINASGAWQTGNSWINASTEWIYTSDVTLHAKWTANSYTITFDAATNGGSKSADGTKSATYESTTSLASCPTGIKNGYCFDGWFTAASSGSKVINPNGSLVANVSDWTDGSGRWKRAYDETVYAVFSAPTTLVEQPARIGGKRVAIDTLDAKTYPNKDTVIVHQSISPAATGDYNISYKLCYENHTPLDVQPTIKYGTGAKVGYDTIKMPMDAIQRYELVAYLKTGTTRGSGTDVTTDTAIISVEKTYPVKVRYIVDGKEIREATEWPTYPSLRTTEIRIPKERNGYALDHLDYGTGITSDSAKDITYFSLAMYATYVKAANAGTITAHYKPADNTVYFFQTGESWYTPYIFDYEGTDYWGSGGNAGKGAGGENKTRTRATRVDFVDNIYTLPIGGNTTKFAIVDDEQENANGTYFQYFYINGSHNPKVAYCTDFNAATPMFVPVATSESDYYLMNTVAKYYRGFWVKYSPDRDSTGYYLHVYNKKLRSDAPYAGEKDPEVIQTLPLRLTQTGEGNTWELTATMDLEGSKTYGFKITKATGASTKTWYSYNGTLTDADHTGKVLDGTSSNIGLTTTSAGDYTFHVFCKNFGTIAANTATAAQVQGQLAVTVDYATNDGDFRVVYVDDSQTNLTVGKSNVEPIASQTIHARANGKDTVTFFVRKNATNRSMKFQKFTDGAWADIAVGGTIGLTNTADQTFTVSKDTTYQIYLQQNADGTTISATGMDYYSGSYYIRTDCVDDHKWDYKQTLEAHRMIESEYASHLSTDPFTHYYVHWVNKNGNVKFVVATKYSPCLTDTLITDSYANNGTGGFLPSGEKMGANVRFMYNKGTNWIKRAYLHGSKEGDDHYLELTETSSGKMKNAGGSAISAITFSDQGNWTYNAEIQAYPGLTGKLKAEYNSQTQYLRGTEDTDETILGGSGGWQNISMTYDFKTNRLISAWRPNGDSINGKMAINADVMIIRRGQRDAEQIVFKNDASDLNSVKYIYGVIQLDYNDLVGMMNRWDYWSYAHCMYYISFPFDVLVSDITGVGTIGQDWRLQRYNGAKRARTGWFAGDGTTTFWEDVHAGDTLHAFEGYSLLLNRTRFNDSSNKIWENKVAGNSVYLFFPSATATTGIVANKDTTITVPAHFCTIDKTFTNQYGATVNHKNTDSHWNMMGTPLFEDKVASTIGDNPADPADGTRQNLKYIYAWNSAGNTLGIQLTLSNTWKFKTMYSYMVQYAGDVTFRGSTVNNSVAARRAESQKKYYVNLELAKEDEFVGRTYVELRENAVDTFMLNEDIYMLKNGVNADMYTLAGGYEVGANVMSVGNHTIPVGIDVKAAGTYTFSMPDNFDGTVTLIDAYAQTRTNLLTDDYEVALSKGNISDRFFLEININETPTAIDGVEGGSLKDGKAHKFIMNDMMYILKDGVLYDAQGKRVQ